MKSNKHIQLVHERRGPGKLSLGAGLREAQGAYTAAKIAQRRLIANLHLIEMLHRPGNVSYARLKGERAEAHRQAGLAQDVADNLDRALDAMESVDPEEIPKRR